jgi:hypothetical protein
MLVPPELAKQVGGIPSLKIAWHVPPMPGNRFNLEPVDVHANRPVRDIRHPGSSQMPER